MLVRLIYASRSTGPITDQVVEDVLLKSQDNNSNSGITGVLCVCGENIFMQVLEGGRDEVNRLYGRVIHDTRHADVTLLEYSEIAERGFTNWRMGRVDLNRINAGMLLKYSEKPRLDPFQLSGRVAIAVLQDLMAAALIVG
jgi:hypothetical protein